jgi:hypothetical protein
MSETNVKRLLKNLPNVIARVPLIVGATHRVWPPDKGAANDSERGFLELNPPAFGHPPYQGGRARN